MRKNGFLTFCCALIPGFGQMYLGYMRRGASILAWFFAIIFVAAALNMGILALILPVVWAYSFFDTFNIGALSPQQRANFRDDYIPSYAWLKSHNFTSGRMQGKSGLVAGWVCIGFGLLMLYNIFISPLLWHLAEYIPFLSTLLNRLPTLIVGVAVIILGLWLLRKNKKTPQSSDDMIPFKGDNNDVQL